MTGREFGPKRTPTPTYGMVYVQVQYKGKNHQLHNIVWNTFRPDRRLVGDETVDHKYKNPDNCALYNLRPETKSGQNLNRNLKPASEQNKHRTPVWGCMYGRPETIRFFPGGTHRAAEELKMDNPGVKFSSANISQSATFGCCHKGWRFAYERVDYDALEAERQRVLSAIRELRDA